MVSRFVGSPLKEKRKKTMNNGFLPYILKQLRQTRQPKIIDAESDSVMYVGDCLPDCTSYRDKKWLIKMVMTSAATGIQTVFYANGSERYDQAWTDRRSLNYTPSGDDSFNNPPMFALADEMHRSIMTEDGKYIIIV